MRNLSRPAARVALLLALLLVGVLLYLLATRPRLLAFAPENPVGIRATTPLRLTFSRPLDPASAAAHLHLTPALPITTSWEGADLIVQPVQPWPSGAAISVTLDAGVRGLGWSPLTVTEAHTWRLTVRQPQLAYLFPAAGAANLYRFDPLQGGSTPLTNLAVGVLDFTVAADGLSIYASLDVVGDSSRLARLDLTQPDAPLETVLDCPQAACRSVQISPDGAWLAYERAALLGSDPITYPQVWLVALPDGAPQLVADPTHQTLAPRWSATGRLAYYDSQRLAYILLDPVSRAELVFPNETGQDSSWQPQGQQFVATEVIPPAGENLTLNNIIPSHLRLFDLTTGASRDLSASRELEDATPAFSPDGAWIAFGRRYLDLERFEPGRQIWLMRPDGSGAQALTREPRLTHFSFAWSPNGDQIAYVRFDQAQLTQPPEIWLLDVASRQSQRIAPGGFAPQWIP
jgi:hypothetical protein